MARLRVRGGRSYPACAADVLVALPASRVHTLWSNRSAPPSTHQIKGDPTRRQYSAPNYLDMQPCSCFEADLLHREGCGGGCYALLYACVGMQYRPQIWSILWIQGNFFAWWFDCGHVVCSMLYFYASNTNDLETSVFCKRPAFSNASAVSYRTPCNRFHVI